MLEAFLQPGACAMNIKYTLVGTMQGLAIIVSSIFFIVFSAVVGSLIGTDVALVITGLAMLFFFAKATIGMMWALFPNFWAEERENTYRRLWLRRFLRKLRDLLSYLLTKLFAPSS